MKGLSGSNSVVECDLAKVEVAGSNPVSRSRDYAGRRLLARFLCTCFRTCFRTPDISNLVRLHPRFETVRNLCQCPVSRKVERLYAVAL